MTSAERDAFLSYESRLTSHGWLPVAPALPRSASASNARDERPSTSGSFENVADALPASSGNALPASSGNALPMDTTSDVDIVVRPDEGSGVHVQTTPSTPVNSSAPELRIPPGFESGKNRCSLVGLLVCCLS